MAQIRISQLTTLTTITGDDFLVIVDSGSSSALTTFRTSIQTLNDTYFAVSGSVLSASFSSHSLFAPTASNIISASYSKTGSVSDYLNFNGTFNGTASWALTSSVSVSSSLALFAVSSSLSVTSSFSLNANSASYVATASFTQLSPLALTASYAATASFALTASYINISLQNNIPQWYGPFTCSSYSESKWGWRDPIERGIPILVLYDDTDIIVQASANVIFNSDATGGPHTTQLRWKEITSSTSPGQYQIPNYTSELATADDWVEGGSHADSGGYSYVCNPTFMFSKTRLKRGSYILWFESRYTRKETLTTQTYGTTFTDPINVANGTHDGNIISTIYKLFDNAIPADTDDQLEEWMYPFSASSEATIYATKPVKQGVMFAATASVSHRSSPSPTFDFVGILFGGKFGRIYGVPFLVDQTSINAGSCNASFTYMSASVGFTASFSASTAGLSVGDTTTAWLGTLPSVASSWYLYNNTAGTLLTSIPIRTNLSTSWA